MLNLDVSDDEAISIEEDTDSDCILCKYTNHDYLDHLYYTLCGSTSKNNMYTTLFDTFNKRMKELESQGFESHQLKKEALINHYETHFISMERAVIEDVRLCKKLMRSLQKKIVTREGVDGAALTQWRSLSNHKISLLRTIKRTKRPLKLQVNKPHDFST